jgi:hypothetical protein
MNANIILLLDNSIKNKDVVWQALRRKQFYIGSKNSKKLFDERKDKQIIKFYTNFLCTS